MIRQDEYIKILWVTAIAFFTAFVRELNDHVDNPEETFAKFLSDILLHGVSGSLFGIMGLAITQNIYWYSTLAGVGGVIGRNVINIVAKIALAYLGAIQQVDLSSINVDELLKQKDETKPPEQQKEEEDKNEET